MKDVNDVRNESEVAYTLLVVDERYGLLHELLGENGQMIVNPTNVKLVSVSAQGADRLTDGITTLDSMEPEDLRFCVPLAKILNLYSTIHNSMVDHVNTFVKER